jgi:hypothetical protein
MANNLSGISYTNNFNNLDGLSIVQADELFIDGTSLDPTNLVPYTGSSKETDLGSQNIKTTHAPTTNADLANKLYVDGAVTTGSGDVLGIVNLNFVRYSGSISDTDLGTYKISSSAVPTTGINLTNKTYVDAQDALRVPYTGGTSNVVLTGTNKFQQAYNATISDTTTVVNRQTLDSAISGLGAGILNLNNTWTGTNTFNNNLTLGDGYNATLAEIGYIGQNNISSATPTTTGITAIAPTPTGTITFSSPTYTMTPSGASTFASFWSSATFTGTIRCFFNFTNMSLANAPGSATITVCQANTANTAYISISTAIAIPQSAPIFSGYFTPNTNASYVGQVFFILSNVKFNPFSWTAFTYGYGAWTVQGNETLNGNETVNGTISITASSLTPLTVTHVGTFQPTISATSSSSDTTLDLVNTAVSGRVWRLGSAGTGSGAGVGNFYIYDSTGGAVWLTISSSGLTTIKGNGTILGNLTVIGYANTGILTATYPSGSLSANPTFTCSNNPSVAYPSRFWFINWASASAYNTLVQAGDFLMVNLDAGTSSSPYYNQAGTVIGGWNQTAGIRVGTSTIQLNGNVGFGRDPSYTVDINGNQRVFNGANANDSMTVYGPNASWSSYLVVGSGTERSGGSTAAVISTNGNLHMDAANSNAMYYGFYANSHGTPNPHLFWGTDIRFKSGVPQQNNIYSYPVVLCDDNQLCRSQALQRYVQMANGLAWGGGSNYTYAFYKYNTFVPAKISGKFSYYVSTAGFAYPYMRIYSQNSGVYRTYTFPAYTNNTYNHMTFPFEYVFLNSDLPEQGWFDIYFYNGGGCITDTGDQLWINVTLLPGSNF